MRLAQILGNNKKPQFSFSHYEIGWKWSTHEKEKLLEYQLNWVKIVIFELLLNYFRASLIFFSYKSLFNKYITKYNCPEKIILKLHTESSKGNLNTLHVSPFIFVLLHKHVFSVRIQEKAQVNLMKVWILLFYTF